MTSAINPHATVWDALERGGYKPHGNPHGDFRARCPRHDGDNPESLHVAVGADGRAVMHCHAHQCRVEDIVAALGLQMGDLFPAGHHRARRRQLPTARRDELTGNVRTVMNVLAGIDALGGDWYLSLRCDCPHCGSPAAILQVSPRYVLVSCPGDSYAERLGYTACTLDQFAQALAGRLADQSANQDRRAA
jgi:hypothetical protein